MSRRRIRVVAAGALLLAAFLGALAAVPSGAGLHAASSAVQSGDVVILSLPDGRSVQLHPRAYGAPTSTSTTTSCVTVTTPIGFAGCTVDVTGHYDVRCADGPTVRLRAFTESAALRFPYKADEVLVDTWQWPSGKGHTVLQYADARMTFHPNPPPTPVRLRLGRSRIVSIMAGYFPPRASNPKTFMYLFCTR